VLLKPEKPFAIGDQTLYSSTLGWRMVNPAMPEQWTISLGASTEKLAGIHGIGREAQDAFAVRSHELTARAWDEGFYDPWVVPVPGTELTQDENLRRDTSLEKLAKLKPAFVKDGTVTAGNASPLNDGASAVLIASEAGAKKAGRAPIARIAGRGTFAVDPDIFGIGPVEAANRALKRAGITWADVDAVELNEAFAAQSLACVNSWPIDPDRVNVNGGAIALGHPLGCTGAKLTTTLLYEMQRRNARYGMVTMCVGGGMGAAGIFERV